jgi:hypothetical protein
MEGTVNHCRALYSDTWARRAASAQKGPIGHHWVSWRPSLSDAKTREEALGLLNSPNLTSRERFFFSLNRYRGQACDY